MVSKQSFYNFGDLVKYQNKLWRFIGMDEDGIVTLVRGEDKHPYEVVEYESVYHQDWEEIELIKKTPIKDPFPDTKPYKSFTERFCESHGITKEQLIKELNGIKKKRVKKD